MGARGGGTSVAGRTDWRRAGAIGGAAVIAGGVVIALVARGGDGERTASSDEVIADAGPEPGLYEEPDPSTIPDPSPIPDPIPSAIPITSPSPITSPGPSPHPITSNAIDAGAVPAESSEETIAALRQQLRAEKNSFMFSRAREELRRLGVPPDFVRRTNERPEIGPEDTDMLELTLEIDRNGALVATWEVHFGDRLFAQKYPPYMTISLTGGPEEVEKRFTPTPGTNTGSAILLAAPPPASYAFSVFLWSQKPDGTQVSDNAGSVFLDLRPR